MDGLLQTVTSFPSSETELFFFFFFFVLFLLFHQIYNTISSFLLPLFAFGNFVNSVNEDYGGDLSEEAAYPRGFGLIGDLFSKNKNSGSDGEL